MEVKSKDLKEIVFKSNEIEMLPQVAVQVINTVSNQNSSANDLYKIITIDQALTTKILKIANSAFYGFYREINSLSRAITILGFRTIKNLVVAVSTKNLFKKSGSIEKILWDHSIGVAIGSQILANTYGDKSDMEESLIGGLLHDIGKVLMNSYDPARFSKIMEMVNNEKQFFTAVEEKFYDCTHAEVGAHVIKKWNLPETMEKIVANHHRFSPDCVSEQNICRRIAFTNLADLICIQLGIGYREPREIALEEQESSLYLGLKADDIIKVVQKIEENYQEEKDLFN